MSEVLIRVDGYDGDIYFPLSYNSTLKDLLNYVNVKLSSIFTYLNFKQYYIDSDMLTEDSINLKLDNRANIINKLKNCGKYTLESFINCDNIEHLDAYLVNFDINSVSNTSCLHNACEKENKKVIEYLLNMGACIDLYGQNSFTPLNYAIYNNKKEIAELLLLNGANYNIKDDYDRSPLNNSVNRNNIDFATKLIKLGADIESKDIFGKTPLNNASYNGLLELVKILLDNGANIETEDEYQCTPIYNAISYQRLDVFKFLLSRGAKEKSSISFLDYAYSTKSDKVIKYLKY